MRLLPVLLLGLCLPASHGAEMEAPLTRIKRFKEALKHAETQRKGGKDVGIRLDSIRELRAADDPRIAEILLEKAFLDDDFRMAEAAVSFLVRTASPASLTWLKEKGLVHPQPKGRFYSLRVLSGFEEPPALALFEPFSRDPHWVLRLEAAVLLAACKEDGAAAALTPLFRDPVVMVRAAALVAAADLGASQHLPEARRALFDKDWRVRSAALEVIVRLKDLSAVDALRKLYDEETEIRLLDDIEQGLYSLGMALHEAKEAAKEEEIRAREAARAAESVDGIIEVFTHKGITEEIYGFKPKPKDPKVLKGRIVFVLDCSQSMDAPLKEHPEPPAGPGAPAKPRKEEYKIGREGEPEKPAVKEADEAIGYDQDKRLPKEFRFPPTKLGFGQRELCKAIWQLRPGISFNVICYQSAGKQRVWKPVLILGSEGSKKEGMNFVKGQSPSGETATYDALVAAIGFDERDLFSRPESAWDPSGWPDTILLVSDGTPTEGQITQIEAFLASVKRLFRICRTRIHTIGVGRDNLPVLERTAQITGGSYLHVADEE